MHNLEPCPDCGGELHYDYFDGNHDMPIIICFECRYQRSGTK